MKSRKRRRGSGFALIFGMIVGAVAGFWLNTTKGKHWRKKTMDQTADFRKDFTQKADEYSTMARDKAKEFSGEVEKFVDTFVTKNTNDGGELGNA